MKKLFVCFIALTLLVSIPLSADSLEQLRTGDDFELFQDGAVEITLEELPEAIQVVLEENYADWYISKIYKVTKADNSEYYSLEFDTGESNPTVLNFDASGNVLEE